MLQIYRGFRLLDPYSNVLNILEIFIIWKPIEDPREEGMMNRCIDASPTGLIFFIIINFSLISKILYKFWKNIFSLVEGGFAGSKPCNKPVIFGAHGVRHASL